MSCLLLNFSNILNGWSLNGLRFCEALKLGYFWLKMTFLTNFKTFQNLNQLRYLKNSNAGNSFWPLSPFPQGIPISIPFHPQGLDCTSCHRKKELLALKGRKRGEGRYKCYGLLPSQSVTT